MATRFRLAIILVSSHAVCQYERVPDSSDYETFFGLLHHEAEPSARESLDAPDTQPIDPGTGPEIAFAMTRTSQM